MFVHKKEEKDAFAHILISWDMSENILELGNIIWAVSYSFIVFVCGDICMHSGI